MFKEKLKNLNCKKLGGIFSGIFFFGIMYGYVIFPTIFKIMLKKQVALKPGSEIRQMWEVIPFQLNFKMYLFNISNPVEVANGQKPIVKEIGPYYFEEWKTKEQIVDNAEEDTATFYIKDTFIFRPDLSEGLTGEEKITTVNPLLTGTALVVKRTRAPMLPMISKAIEIIFNQSTPFITEKALDILFRGMSIDCSSHEFPSKAVCAAFETEVPGIIKQNDTHFLFSLFGSLNASETQKLTVLRGLKNVKDVGRVLRHQDEPEMDVWSTDECNQFKGTDGTIFPPGLRKEEGLWAFVPSLCRSMQAKYEGKSSYVGIPTGRFGIDFGDYKTDESIHCYCRDPPDDCPEKGTFDLMSCSNAPLIVSLPHFYKADPILLEKISGLKPDKEKHATQIDFVAISGTPVRAANRLQFSWDIEPVEEVEALKNVQKVIIPAFWVEESVQLNKTYTNMLKYQLFLTLKLSATLKWSTIIIGLLGMCLSGYGQYIKNNTTIAITPIVKSAVSNTPNGTTENEEIKTNPDSKLEAKLKTIHNIPK